MKGENKFFDSMENKEIMSFDQEEIKKFNRQIKTATKNLDNKEFRNLAKEIVKIYHMQIINTYIISDQYIDSLDQNEETKEALRFIRDELDDAYFTENYYQELKDEYNYKDLFSIDKKLIKLDDEAYKELKKELEEIDENSKEDEKEEEPNA